MLRLFVYGTLKKGFYNHGYLGKARLIGTAILRGYDMYTNGGFPYITKGDGVVHGEVYEVTNEHDIKNIRMLESGSDETDVTIVFDGNSLEDEYEVSSTAKAYTFPEKRESDRWVRVDDGVFNLK